ncbi:amino acid adenylation domain-containing protein [Erysipelotrichaceae bacterium 51-3]
MRNDTLASRLLHLVKQNPDAPALIYRNQSINRKEFASRIQKIQNILPKHARIGVVLDHQPELIESLFAILMNGSCYVPAEPSFPVGRIHRMMNEAECPLIVTQKKYGDQLEGFPLLFIEDLMEQEQDCTSGFDLAKFKDFSIPSNPAYILYTSGTTGMPKGIEVTNANVCHYVDAFQNEFHVTAEDRMLQYSVCSFDIFTEEVFASLLNGATLVLPEDKDKQNAKSLLQFVDQNRVTMVSGFPYLLEKFNQEKKLPASLRLLISGGDVLRENYVTNLIDQAAIYNTYGPSETTVCASYFHCLPGTALADGTFPIGKPVLDVQIELYNDKHELCKAGEVGELIISGKGVSNGYIKDHDHENDAFETLPDGTRRYRSGDCGLLLPDGNLAFLNRKDSQVMIYGRRVEIQEVESALNQCTGINLAVVDHFLDEEGLPYLVAYIVTNPRFEGLHELKKELAHQLPSFMIPEFFVRLGDIVLTSNGKPDHKKLPQVLKSGEIPWS